MHIIFDWNNIGCGGAWVKVIVADKQATVRYALRVLLLRQKDLELVGEAHDLEALMDQIRRMQPDLILVDWSLPGLLGGYSMADMRGACADLRVLAMSSQPEMRQEALAAGADEFIHKMDPPDRLLNLLRSFIGIEP